MCAPQLLAGLLVRKWKREAERHAALERLIDRCATVRGEDRDAFKRVEALEQVVDLQVRVTIVARAHLGALREQRVSLVEQKDDLAVLRGIEDRREISLGLTDPLGHHFREIDLIEIEAELARDHARDHRLARAGLALKQRGEAARR